MKKLSLLILLFAAANCKAQEKAEYYNCAVVLRSGEKITGKIYQTGDTNITMLTHSSKQSTDMIVISVDSIYYAEIFQKANELKGFLIGGGVGLLLGGIIGSAMAPRAESSNVLSNALEDSRNKIKGASTGATAGLIVGGLIGLGIGSNRMSIVILIQGDRKKYNESARAEIIRYSIMQK